MALPDSRQVGPGTGRIRRRGTHAHSSQGVNLASGKHAGRDRQLTRAADRCLAPPDKASSGGGAGRGGGGRGGGGVAVGGGRIGGVGRWACFHETGGKQKRKGWSKAYDGLMADGYPRGRG